MLPAGTCAQPILLLWHPTLRLCCASDPSTCRSRCSCLHPPFLENFGETRHYWHALAHRCCLCSIAPAPAQQVYAGFDMPIEMATTHVCEGAVHDQATMEVQLQPRYFQRCYLPVPLADLGTSSLADSASCLPPPLLLLTLAILSMLVLQQSAA